MENLFNLINDHLIYDEKPSIWLNTIIDKLKCSELAILARLTDIPQEKKYHPEGVVWNHIMLVVDISASLRDKSNNPQSFMWASLLHDIGKVKTTQLRKGKWTSYNHDEVGAKEVKSILSKLSTDEIFIRNTSNLVKHHMNHIYIHNNLPFGNVYEMINEVDMNDMLLLFYSDSMGRGNCFEVEFIEKSIKMEKIKEILKNKYSFIIS